MTQMDHPNIHPAVHPPIVALAFITAAFLLGRLVPLPLAVLGYVRTLGLVITLAGFLCGFLAFREFNRAQTTVDPHGSVSQIVSSGIYRYSRNPIYSGFFLIVVGLPLTFGSLWGILLAPFFMLTMNRLVITHEEAYLEKKFGNAYTGYKSHVRRWL